MISVAPAAASDGPAPAEREWNAIRSWLHQNHHRVLLAATYDERNERGRTHVLALTTIVHRRRYLPGLDEDLYQPFPGEAAFCGVPSAVRKLQFRLHLSRHEEHRIGLPDCLDCLDFCRSLTRLPTANLAAESRKTHRVQINSRPVDRIAA